MKSAGRSDIGRVRANNEDTILADDGHGLFLLADGMGGHRGGEVASDLAVRAAHSYLKERADKTDDEGLPLLLAEALAAAHSAVFKRGMQDPALEGMGTTLDLVYLRKGRAWVCHIGDSRVYLLDGKGLRQITTDDNLAAIMRNEDHLPPEEIPPSAMHILIQAVGVSDELIPQIHILELKPADILILCSDGLTGMVEDAEMEEIVRRHRDDLDAATGCLVEAANEHGGHDNISVILVAPEVSPPILLLSSRPYP